MSDTDLRAALKVFADMGSYDHPHGVTALAWFEAIMAARKVLNDQPANVAPLNGERKPKFQGW